MAYLYLLKAFSLLDENQDEPRVQEMKTFLIHKGKNYFKEENKRMLVLKKAYKNY